MNKEYINEKLNFIREDLKTIRAFLQGLAYANGVKSDEQLAIENAWHYSNRARVDTIWIDDILNYLNNPNKLNQEKKEIKNKLKKIKENF